MKTIEITSEDEVMFYDTDVGGVVHNLAYLRMIEFCRTKLAEQIGFNLREMAETQVYPVVVRTEIDYRRHLDNYCHGILDRAPPGIFQRQYVPR